MRTAQLPRPDRRRRVPANFSWVDRRLVRDRHVQRCGPHALALYLVLVTVGDANGLSFYADETLCAMLRWSRIQLKSALSELIEVGLVAFQRPFYQVLGLDPQPQQSPKQPVAAQPPTETPAAPDQVAAIMAELKRRLAPR